MATRNYEGKKFEKGLVTKIADALTIEEALQININNKPFTVTMRTPGNDNSLVRGMLFQCGDDCDCCDGENTVFIFLPEQLIK